MTYSCRETLTLALSATLTARRTSLPSQLLSGHGLFIVALALAALPSRKMAEILLTLTPAERPDAYRHLSYGDRDRLTNWHGQSKRARLCSPAAAYSLPRNPCSPTSRQIVFGQPLFALSSNGATR